ncbi:MAG: winged helix-turn-helix domain-containing protein [Nitrososphaeria archaeon]
MTEKRLDPSNEHTDKIALDVFRFIKSLGYIDKKSIMYKFNLNYNELEQIFNYLEKKGLLKPISRECDTRLCKDCPYANTCNLGNVKFYVLGE